MADLVIVASAVAPVQVIEKFTGPAIEVITAGTYCRLDTTTGKIAKGNGTNAAESRNGGVAVDGATVIGTTITCVRKGIIDLGAAIDALAFDADVFLSDTDGTLATTAGTVSKVVGTVVPGWGATTADKLLRINL